MYPRWDWDAHFLLLDTRQDRAMCARLGLQKRPASGIGPGDTEGLSGAEAPRAPGAGRWRPGARWNARPGFRPGSRQSV